MNSIQNVFHARPHSMMAKAFWNNLQVLWNKFWLKILWESNGTVYNKLKSISMKRKLNKLKEFQGTSAREAEKLYNKRAT